MSCTARTLTLRAVSPCVAPPAPNHRLGSGTAVSIFVCAQLVTSIILDLTGLVGFQQRAFSWSVGGACGLSLSLWTAAGQPRGCVGSWQRGTTLLFTQTHCCCPVACLVLLVPARPRITGATLMFIGVVLVTQVGRITVCT
jgi:hypothetical protein